MHRAPRPPHCGDDSRPGELIRLLYRLGQRAASGMLTLSAPAGRREVLVLRRGAAVCADGELARRALLARLARLVAEPALRGSFDGGVAAYPPGALHQVALAGWVRSHLEAQLDGALAGRLVHELAGSRLVLRAELLPAPMDDTDRRMLAALDRPRRLDQIWPLARAPRFRLLAFVHFLRAVGALALEDRSEDRRGGAPVGVAGASPHREENALDPRRLAALRLLGVEGTADHDAVKRAYRRLARALHPDLHPHIDDQRRRALERQFAEVAAAYQALQ